MARDSLCQTPHRKYKTFAGINISALRHNYAAISDYIHAKNPDTRIMCMVKADCYGHSTEICIPALVSMGVGAFGVSCIEEALDVCMYAPGSEILILGYTLAADASVLAENRFVQTVYGLEYAKELSEAAVRAGVTVRAHIKVDSGMNRLGFQADDPEKCVREIRQAMSLPGLSFEGIFTHFACADAADESSARKAHSDFMRIVDMLGADAEGLCVHCCNSAAALRFPEFRHDMVRVGIILYGLSPDRDFSLPVDLRPVMTVETTVALVHTVKKGESVSYGGRFTAQKDMKVATIGIGYADGFLRSFSEGGRVLINGKYAPVVGRVCMDQCMVCVDGMDVRPGDAAVVFDAGGENIRYLSSLASTIDYELVCLVGKRIRRIAVEAPADKR